MFARVNDGGNALIRAAMDFDNDAPDLRSAHVIVVGNEKGGAGKSTISIHLTVALLKAGYKVACIDLDTRQQTLTRFFENRRSWSSQAHWPIELPLHCAMRARRIQRRARQRGAGVRAVRRRDRRRRARIRIRRHRHAGQRLLSDAARPFARRHAGLAAQRQLHRHRRVLARPARPHAARRGLAIRRSRDGGAAQAPARRQRSHRLGDGAQPHGLDRQQQRAPDRRQHRAAVERIELPRRRRAARSRHLPRIVSRSASPRSTRSRKGRTGAP